MLKCWSNFAKYGNPNGLEAESWTIWNDNDKVYEFGSNVGIINDRYKELYKIIDEFLGL